VRIKGLGRVALVIAVLVSAVTIGQQSSLAQVSTAEQQSDCTPGELISRRTRDTKTVLHADCSYTTTYGTDLHYEAAPGRWEEVDLRFRPDGSGHVADRNTTIVRVTGARLDVSDRDDGAGISWLLPGPPDVHGHRARFASQGLEWEYAVTTEGVKLAATVAEARGPQTYRFTYQLLNDGELTVNDAGDLVGEGFHVPRAFALGADGRIYQAGSWRLLDGPRVAFDFDDSLLPEAAFPYLLDPTTSFNSSKPEDEGHVSKTGSSYPPSSCTGWTDNSSTIDTERATNAKGDQFWTTNGFMSWDTSSLPDSASVTGATLKFYARSKSNYESRSLTADWYSAWPIDCADFSETAQTTAIPGLPLADIPVTSDKIVQLSGSATGVSRLGRTGLRTHISGGQPTTGNSLAIWQFGNASNMPNPQLNVTYSLPSGPPTITSASDSPDPVTAGQTITFNVGWSDPDAGESVRALICKTNSVKPSGSCADDTWATGSFGTSTPATAALTTSSGMAGTNNYFAFACEVSGACSSGLSGTFTVGLPNSPPTISSVTDSPDPVTYGNTVNFSVSWSDPNSGNTVRAVICKTNAISAGSCPGGAWATGALSSSSPATSSYTTTSSDVGTRSYWAFACDQSNACSSSLTGTFQVVAPNQPPQISFTVSPTSGDRSTVFTAHFDGTYDPNNHPITYRIDWGDGAVSNAQRATHTYRNAGTYTVSGRACDSLGACSSSSRSVTVAFSNRPPSANLTVNPERGDVNTMFSASVTGSDPEGDAVSYEIDWGDGTTTPGQSDAHRYASPGTYTITGRVTDAYGARAEAYRDVEVCAAMAQGQCVQTPVPVPDACRDHAVGCSDDPTYLERPGAAGDVLEAIQTPFTGNGEVLVLSANVEQVYAIEGHRCTDRNPRKDCDEAAREERFAQRVLDLAAKGEGTEDGMGQIPDLILLQEVKLEDAEHIRRELRQRGLMFEIGNGRKTNNPRIPNSEAQVNRECERHYENDEDKAKKCKRLTWVEGDSSILYNEDTLRPPVNRSHFDARYWLEDRVTCQNSNDDSVAPASGVDDSDGDDVPDCKLKWARQYTASFNEIRLNDEGEPTNRITALRVAVATVHLVDRGHFGRDCPNCDTNRVTHANVKDRQVRGLDRHMNETYEEADVKILGGDFNIHKCSTKDNEDPGDYPAPSVPPLPTDVGCLPWAWWTSLTEGRDYVEGVYSARGDEDDRLVPQYKDGCDVLAEDGTCEDEHHRTQRIDFVFGSSPLAVEDASHDLTCGQVEPDENQRDFPPNCDSLFNPQRYSDHRFLWGLFGADLT
jgi:PKD repeat protein